MQKMLAILLGTVIVLILPVYNVVDRLQDRARLAAQGDISGEFWLPEKSRVLVNDYRQWKEELPDDSLSLCVPFDRYQREFSSDSHVVCVEPQQVFYATHQGRVVVKTSVPIDSPLRVCSLKDFKHLGGGEILWTVEDSTKDVAVGIVRGLIGGFLADVVVILVVLVLIGLGWSLVEA